MGHFVPVKLMQSHPCQQWAKKAMDTAGVKAIDTASIKSFVSTEGVEAELHSILATAR